MAVTWPETLNTHELSGMCEYVMKTHRRDYPSHFKSVVVRSIEGQLFCDSEQEEEEVKCKIKLSTGMLNALRR